MRLAHVSRVAAVTLALTAVSALTGVGPGVLAMAILLPTMVAPGGGPATASPVVPLALGAAYGAGLGALLGPPAAWLLLRRVPLRRAIGGVALGTVVGELAAGLLLDPSLGSLGALAGFAATVLGLWVTSTTAPAT